jgi:hypothetical protein
MKKKHLQLHQDDEAQVDEEVVHDEVDERKYLRQILMVLQ